MQQKDMSAQERIRAAAKELLAKQRMPTELRYARLPSGPTWNRADQLSFRQQGFAAGRPGCGRDCFH
jgi:hypothetical protein